MARTKPVLKKTCSECGKSLPLNKFYRRGKGCRRADCAKCSLLKTQRYRGTSKGRVSARAASKRWTNKNLEKVKVMQRSYKQSPKGKLVLLESQRKFRRSAKGKEAIREYVQRNKIKVRAHRAVADAIRSGRLKRGKCIVKGCRRPAQGHHEDYAKPLDVVWLCDKHHKEYHAGRLKIKCNLSA
jgi:hypothetical protein